MFKGYHNSINSPLYRGFPNLTFGGNTGTAYNFSRCLLWLDAAYGTSTVVNGASVSSWSDRINGVLYTQATAGNQPTYVLSDASFNNLPTINFGNLSTRILIGNSSFSLGSTTHAIIARNTINPGAAEGTLMIGDGGFRGFTGSGAGVNLTGYGFYNGNTAFTRTNTEDTNMHIIIANRNFILIDGVNLTSVISSNFGFTFSALGSGNSNWTPSCIIAEVLLYDYLMSETDAITLSNNINGKYQKY